MRSLVTGGAGFLGSHVAEHCLRLGQEVVVADDLSGGFAEHVPQGAVFEQGSITDASFVTRIFEKYRFDFVYHLAAYAAEGLSHFVRCYNYSTNVVGSVLLINKAVEYEVKCFVFTSSIAVYGRNRLPMDESLQPRPEDPYGISKYAVELDLEAAHRMFGLKYVIFRPHNIYGERQNITDPYRNVVGIFVNQVLQGRPMTIFGDGLQTRAFSYVDDVAPHIARSVRIPESFGQTVNIGADAPYTVKVLAEVIARSFGLKAEIRYLPVRNEVPHAYADHRKARRLFDIQQSVSLENGITRMANWALRHGLPASSRLPAVELHRNLPACWRRKRQAVAAHR